MATEFKLPELGENIESADIISVLVKKGDHIEKEQGIIEIETDKATIEVPSSVSGNIVEVLVKEGDNVKVGQTIIKVEDNGTATAQPEKKKEKQDVSKVKEENKEEAKAETETQSKTSTGQIVEFKVPDLGENIESADVINVLVKKGDMISKDQGVIEIETDKATIEVPSSVQGKIVELNVKSGDKVKVGDVLIKVESSGEVQKTKPKEKTTEPVEKKSEVEQDQKPVKVAKGVSSGRGRRKSQK